VEDVRGAVVSRAGKEWQSGVEANGTDGAAVIAHRAKGLVAQVHVHPEKGNETLSRAAHSLLLSFSSLLLFLLSSLLFSLRTSLFSPFSFPLSPLYSPLSYLPSPLSSLPTGSAVEATQQNVIAAAVDGHRRDVLHTRKHLLHEDLLLKVVHTKI
jgi:hypothetical protein